MYSSSFALAYKKYVEHIFTITGQKSPKIFYICQSTRIFPLWKLWRNNGTTSSQDTNQSKARHCTHLCPLICWHLASKLSPQIWRSALQGPCPPSSCSIRPCWQHFSTLPQQEHTIWRNDPTTNLTAGKKWTVEARRHWQQQWQQFRQLKKHWHSRPWSLVGYFSKIPLKGATC